MHTRGQSNEKRKSTLLYIVLVLLSYCLNLDHGRDNGLSSSSRCSVTFERAVSGRMGASTREEKNVTHGMIASAREASLPWPWHCYQSEHQRSGSLRVITLLKIKCSRGLHNSGSSSRCVCPATSSSAKTVCPSVATAITDINERC